MICHASKGVSKSSNTTNAESPSLATMFNMLKSIIQDQTIIKEQLTRIQSSSNSSSSSSSSVFTDFINVETDEAVDGFNDYYSPSTRKTSKSKKKSWSPFEDRTNEMDKVDAARGNI